MSILKYLYNKTRRGECLDTTTPKINDTICRLHNILYDQFLTNKPIYELTITFDDRKINVNAIDDIHSLVKFILREYPSFDFFVMREWSKAGAGRLHYHGILKQNCGGQTELARLKAKLKHVFGRDCRVGYISFYDSYITYILKRTLQEYNVLYTEWYSSLLIHSLLTDLEYSPPEIYNYDKLLELQNKRTRKN